ncbi:MAG TPA: hypothetical protein GXZ20_07320 [Halanaerobiaceae bacterium]|jgi:Mg2+/Co2+ transporter CorB|nr:hypothetical protein [Halanaerobiaceae bacterium]
MNNFKNSFFIATITFFIAILVTLSSQSRVENVSLLPAVLILLVIIFIGIITDMVGVAVTVADPRAINAMAARKVFGARSSLFLLNHADKVANLMCDIIGDICGTVSGAIGTAIGIRLIIGLGGPQTLINMIILGLISALTVGGKAFFKSYAINNADNIILFVGKILDSFKLVGRIIWTRLRGEG